MNISWLGHSCFKIEDKIDRLRHAHTKDIEEKIEKSRENLEKDLET